jgi:hypothetical protein
MRPNRIVLLLLTVLFSTTLLAQRPRYEPSYYMEKGFLIHFTSPLSLFSKAGVMVEYKVGVQRSIMFGYTNYWGYFPGYQGYAVFRQYLNTWRHSRHENFLYVKGGVGHADYKPADWLVESGQTFKAPGDYFFGGAGFGRHFNFGHFFMESVVGLKYTGVPDAIDDYNERIFYVTGPGAIVEASFNFGVQF